MSREDAGRACRRGGVGRVARMGRVPKTVPPAEMPALDITVLILVISLLNGQPTKPLIEVFLYPMFAVQ